MGKRQSIIAYICFGLAIVAIVIAIFIDPTKPQLQSFTFIATSNNQTTVEVQELHRCYLGNDESLLWQGASGECEVLDANNNHWFVSPNNKRTLMDGCPNHISDTVSSYFIYAPVVENKAPETVDQYPNEVLVKAACESQQAAYLKLKWQQILKEGGQ